MHFTVLDASHLGDPAFTIAHLLQTALAVQPGGALGEDEEYNEQSWE